MANHALGYITASTVSAILTGKDPAKLLVGSISFAQKIAVERLGIAQFHNQFTGSTATDWGNEMEADAIKMYEQANFAAVHSQQKGIVEPDKWLSCTPDGYVGTDGLVEVKCPYNEYVHLNYLIDSDSLKKEYYDQCQFQLMLSGRAWVDLVSYHPHYTEPYNLVTVRIEPDLEWLSLFHTRIELIEQQIQHTTERLAQCKK